MLSPKQPKKILVVGVGRSGTTAIYSLLQRILESTNPGSIDYVYEPFHWDRATFNKPFSKLNGQFQRISSLSVEGIYHHKSMPLFCDDHSQIGTDTQSWLKSLLQPNGTNTHSLIKSIRAGGRLPAIKQLSPELKIIALFRNPLEVINSSINMFSFFGDDFYQSDYERFIAEVKQRESAQSIIASEKRVEREYSFWRHMNEQMAEDATAKKLDILPVIHEQYISQRELIVREICNHVGVEFNPAFVEYASESVGPTTEKKNNLTAQEYLFLEKQLDSYQSMVARLTDFQIADTNLATREKFIVSNFCEKTPATENFFTRRHLRRELESNQRQIATLTDQITNLHTQLSEHQQKGSLQVEGKNTSDARDARIRTLEQQTNQKHDKIVELQASAADHVTTINKIREKLTAEKNATESLQRELQGKQPK